MAYRIITFPTTAGGKPSSTGAGPVVGQQDELNRTATPPAEKQLTVAAYDSVLPVPYGRIKVPALLANVFFDAGQWWNFWCIWGQGEIDGYEAYLLNDQPLPFRFVTERFGATPQAADLLHLRVLFALAFPTLPTFNETLDGVAYTTFGFPQAYITQPPQLNAIIRGHKLYDPRVGGHVLSDPSTWSYSANSALVLADFLRSPIYGAGLVVDDASLIEAADYCDTEGRTTNLLVDRKAKLSDWIATLATAANVYLDPNGGSVKLVPDSNRSAVGTFTHADGQILSVTGEQTEIRANLPTVIEVIYTDPTTWKDASVVIERAGVSDGATPWRKSSVRMPWIQSEALATREAFLRMNKIWLRTPTFTIALMDEALEPEAGDPIHLTYPDSGYTALLKVKVGSAQTTDAGWNFGVFYDDPGAYVDDRIADPTPPTDQPDPFTVPAVRNLVAIDDPATPRIIANWDAPLNYPYVGGYPYTVHQVGVSPSLVASGVANYANPTFTTGDLTVDQDYVVTVWVRNVFGQLGPPTSVTVHINADTYVAARYDFRTPTLVNMQRLFDYGTGEYYWVTSMGDLWNPTFPNPLDSYTNPLFTYHTPGTSTLTTEEYDPGVVYNGTWDSTIDATDINGTGTRYIELRVLSGDPWTRHAGLSYVGSGRRVRLSSEATGSGTQRVDALGSISVTIDR